jgi:predicted DNA-binding transcriptional regulator AlpA
MSTNEAQQQPQQQEVNTPRRVYRQRKVRERLDGVSMNTVYRLMERSNFPRPVKLGNSPVNVWDGDEVDRWISAQLDGGAK